jgi:quinoprotein glucose dehydrogenase
MRTSRLGITLAALVLALASPTSPAAQNGQSSKGWPDYGGGPDNSKYVALDQITKSNVSRLQVDWSYPTQDNTAYVFNPIVVDDVMYVLARNNSLVALDAASGKELWIHANLRGIASRGVNYWESKDRKERRLMIQINHHIQAIDARTGKSILTFGRNGLVDLREGLDRDPATIARVKSDTPGRIFENLLLVGSSTGEAFLSTPGHLRAYDVITGKLVWTFRTIPQPGEFGYETWPKDAWRYVGGANTWGEITLDEKRGIAFFPTGSPTYDMYGADRIGSNLFGNCLIAIDAKTGKRLWHYQMVHHDLWDYDPTSAPQLITVRQNGRTIDAVAQATKHGFLFAFNRVTGEPLWPVEERPVPKSDVPGEQAWPTQPYPTKPPPFARQSMTVEDLNPYFLTNEERIQWASRLSKARNEGLFTPPAWQRDTIQIPGARGGSNFGTTAADPAKGLMYVLTQDWPSIVNIEGTELAAQPGRGNANPAGQGQSVYQQRCESCHAADRTGSPTVPSLVGIADRMRFEDFRVVVSAGKGEMPAFPAIDLAAMNALYAFLGGGGRGRGAGPGAPDLPVGGIVVAAGGAPGGLEPPPVSEQILQARYGGNNRFVGPPYPEGVEAPKARLYSGYGLNWPYIIGPPWSSIVAYDLNTGTIKWRKPLGEDPEAMKLGGKDTGMLQGGERRGIVVTSTGLLFVNARDGKLRAYDADNGNILWTFALPAGTQGIPSMYQVKGRQYLTVNATSPLTFGRPAGGGGAGGGGAAQVPRAYMTFALPK